MEKVVEIVGQGHEGVVRLPSLEISSKDNEVYSLGEVPKETWSLVKQLEQKIDDKGYAMVEQAEMSVRASCSLKRATYALISSRQCDAERLNQIFDLEMRLGKCLDRCKIALIKYDSTCDDVLECSTIGFMYAIEGHQRRAGVKFKSASTKAEDIKSVFRDVNSELNEVSNEMKEMRTDLVDKQSDADNKEEEKKKTVRDLAEDVEGKRETMTGLDAAISDLERAWFPNEDNKSNLKREKDGLEVELLILGQNRITAQTEEEKASAFNRGIGEAMGAFKKIEAGLQRQELFWDSISVQYENIVGKLKELDEDSSTDAMNDLLSSTAFKYDALVTHCWFQAMRNCLKPTKHLLSECVNRLYRNVTDHPTSPSAAQANLEQMMEADDEEIKQLLKEWSEFDGNSNLEAVEAAKAEKPTVRRRTKPLDSEPQPLSPPSQPAPAPAAPGSIIVSLEQFRVRIALLIVLLFAVLVLFGGSSKK